jgi:precorrin-6B methylase 1
MRRLSMRRLSPRSSTPLTTDGSASVEGSLTVVGTGIDSSTQLTAGARAAIASADVVLYMLADPVTVRRVQLLNANARSLTGHYGPSKDRRQTYAEIADEVVAEVLDGSHVCLVLYGHPGFYALPGREAIRRVRDAGLSARMSPAVSSLDCLFADLEIDPAEGGLQMYGATYFLRRRPPVDPRATLVLLQIGMLGEEGGAPTPAVTERFAQLIERLRELYGPRREALLYEASPYPGVRPRIDRFGLDEPIPPAPPLVSMLCIRG